MTATRAWAALLSAITAYEILAPDGHLLTEGVRAARAKHPALDAAVTSSIVITCLHLLDALGPTDPFKLLAVVRR